MPPSLRRVVKNGSNACRCTSGVIPAPLSAKMISTSSVTAGPCRNRDGAGTSVGECVGCGVEKQVGQDLAIRSRIAVDHKALRHLDRHRDRCLLQHRPQARDNLVGRFAEAELPPLGMRAVDRDLLERLDQFAGAMQVSHQLLGGVARGRGRSRRAANGATVGWISIRPRTSRCGGRSWTPPSG